MKWRVTKCVFHKDRSQVDLQLEHTDEVWKLERCPQCDAEAKGTTAWSRCAGAILTRCNTAARLSPGCRAGVAQNSITPGGCVRRGKARRAAQTPGETAPASGGSCISMWTRPGGDWQRGVAGCGWGAAEVWGVVYGEGKVRRVRRSSSGRNPGALAARVDQRLHARVEQCVERGQTAGARLP